MEEETELNVDEENAASNEMIIIEKAKGSEMRERVMECLGGIKKRLAEQLGKEEEAKKTRRKSGELFQWLSRRTVMELDLEIKEKERKERQEEREFQRQQQQEKTKYCGLLFIQIAL